RSAAVEGRKRDKRRAWPEILARAEGHSRTSSALPFFAKFRFIRTMRAQVQAGLRRSLLSVMRCSPDENPPSRAAPSAGRAQAPEGRQSLAWGVSPRNASINKV